MAVGTPSAVSRLAVERARARRPGIAPDSVEIVELTRGQTYVVVRMLPQGLLVVDEGGRLVRGREKLVLIGSHLLAVARVRAHAAEARLERRRVHVAESIPLLEAQRRQFARTGVRRGIAAVTDALEELGLRLETLSIALIGQHGLQPTERTLRRTVALLNDAALADRVVVRSTRLLAAELARLETVPVTANPLRRWVIARLASSDIPLFYPELDEVQTARAVDEFVGSARARDV